MSTTRPDMERLFCWQKYFSLFLQKHTAKTHGKNARPRLSRCCQHANKKPVRTAGGIATVTERQNTDAFSQKSGMIPASSLTIGYQAFFAHSYHEAVNAKNLALGVSLRRWAVTKNLTNVIRSSVRTLCGDSLQGSGRA